MNEFLKARRVERLVEKHQKNTRSPIGAKDLKSSAAPTELINLYNFILPIYRP